MARLLRKLFFGPIPILSSPRFQLYGTLVLSGWCFWTLLHMPQWFWDYIIRCTTCPLALFLCLRAAMSRGRLSILERILCSVLLAGLIVLTPIFILAAMNVRMFSNR